MNPLLQQALGAFIRTGLAFLAGYVVKAGIWTQSDAETYIAAATLALLALGWSLWQKYHARIKFLTALDAPTGASEAMVDDKIKRGAGSVLAALTLIVLASSLSTGCASSGVRHIATVTSVAAHAALSAVQDTEMALTCGKPNAPQPPACIADDQHKANSAKLAEAFGWDITVATTIRDWPATGTAPTGLGTLLGQITSTINYVLDHLPEGTLKSKLLVRLGGGQ